MGTGKGGNGDEKQQEMEAGSKLIDVFNFSNSTLGHVGFVSGSKKSRRKRRGKEEEESKLKRATPLAQSF